MLGVSFLQPKNTQWHMPLHYWSLFICPFRIKSIVNRCCLPKSSSQHYLFVYLLFVYLFTCLFVCLFTLRLLISVETGRKSRVSVKFFFAELLGWDPVEDWISSRASKMHSTCLNLPALHSLWLSALYLPKWRRYGRFSNRPFSKGTHIWPMYTLSKCT